jgi:hypothetical protein
MNGPIVQHAGVYNYDYTNKWFTPCWVGLVAGRCAAAREPLLRLRGARANWRYGLALLGSLVQTSAVMSALP